MSFATWLNVFVSEKNINTEETFEFSDSCGVYNNMPYGVVIEAMQTAPKREQAAIKNMLVKIDFQNGDVRHYLRHLGAALANNRLVGAGA